MHIFLDEIHNTSTPFGTCALWWLGQMGLIVKAKDTVACIDYFASDDALRKTPAPIPSDEMENIDIFLGTHDHLDHIDHEAWKIWGRNCPGARFIFPRAHVESVNADGINGKRAIGLNDGEHITIGDITVHAVAAAHEFLDRDPASGNYPYLQYIIEGNGLRIHHAGDTVRYEGMLPKIKSFGRIDVELLPINGRDAVRYRKNCIGNMTYQESADFAGEVCPSMVIPGHWDMFADNSADPYAFADYIDAKYTGKFTCKIPKVMEKIMVQ